MISAVSIQELSWSRKPGRLRLDTARCELSSLPCKVHMLARGEVFECAQLPASVFLVASGSLKIASRSEGSQRETIIAILGDGELFGRLPGAGEILGSYAVALDDCRLSEYESAAFEQAVQSSPEILIRITQMIGRRLQRLESRLSQLLFKDSRQRIAFVLVDLLEDWAKSHPAGTLLSLRLTHQDIANLAGLTRETVSMALAEFELDELIQTFGRKIVVRDPEGLKLLRDGKLKIRVPA